MTGAGDTHTASIGGYPLRCLLGTGGMASVYLSERRGAEGFCKPVAIKIINVDLEGDPDAQAMFRDEARIAQHLSHGNIVQVFEFGCDASTYFLVMEYIEGVSLRQLLNQQPGRRLPVALALHVTRRVLDALEHAHQRCDTNGTPIGIVHRDISPHNIMISVDGQVKLTDFGVAFARIREQQTQAGVVKGKLAYMPPEQAEASGRIDCRADLYAVALVLREMLTGARPPIGTPVPVVSQQRAASEVENVFETVISRALATCPADRYESAAALRNALDAATADMQEASTRSSPAALAALVAASAPDPGLDDALDRVIGDSEQATSVLRAPRLGVDAAGPSDAAAIPLAVEHQGTQDQEPPSKRMIIRRRVVFSGMGLGLALAALFALLSIFDSRGTQSPLTTATQARPRQSRPALALPTEPGESSASAGEGSEGSLLKTNTPATERTPRDRRPRRNTAKATKVPSSDAKAMPGELWVNLVPWAEVFINGEQRGTTPLKLTLPPGRYRIDLQNPHLSLRRTLEVRLQSRAKVSIQQW